jgi:RNA polymerase sigma factor (sigma-70 family)
MTDLSETIRDEVKLESLVPAAILELSQGLTDGCSLNHLSLALFGPIRAFMSVKGWGLDDPEFAASEVLSQVLDSLDRYDPNRGAFNAWVWGIARNHLRHLLRTAARRDEASNPNKFQMHHAREHHLPEVSDGQKADLVAAVLQLEPRDYELLFLLFSEKLDATTVAEILAMSPAAVRQRKKRLIARLEGVYRGKTFDPAARPKRN